MEKIIEVVSIKQVKKSLPKKYQSTFEEGLPVVKSPNVVAEFLQKMIGDEDRENFMVIGLDIKNRIVSVHRAHVGSLNVSVVHPREVFKSLILSNCASVIFAHNHPSGNCWESPEDLDVTKRLVEAGNLIGIEVLDHLIVSDTDFNSLAQKRMM